MRTIGFRDQGLAIRGSRLWEAREAVPGGGAMDCKDTVATKSMSLRV